MRTDDFPYTVYIPKRDPVKYILREISREGRKEPWNWNGCPGFQKTRSKPGAPRGAFALKRSARMPGLVGYAWFFDGFHDNRNAPGKIFGISYKILLTKNTSDALLKVEHLDTIFS